MNAVQLEKVKNKAGFIAALDQSGGSTPKALRLYGIPDDSYSGDKDMFTLIHGMRSRIMTSPSFQGDRILCAILFENTMDRKVEGKPTAKYLWEDKNIVPFLKVDKGLAAENNGVQLMRDIPNIGELLHRAQQNGIFGTKMRSFVKLANKDGIKAIVDQQFEVGERIMRHGLIPILEPEVDIKSPEKQLAEQMLKMNIMDHLNKLGPNELIMLKLTLPTQSNLYKEFVDHPNVLKVAALSGGYSRDEANALLAQNKGVIASFSRALTEGLTLQQNDDKFDTLLDNSIGSIYAASMA